MVANFLIGLREGLEASVVVGIIVAYLVKVGRRDALPAIWTGVGTAVVGSMAAGAIFTLTSRSLTFEAQELFGGVMSIVAVAFVTYMIFWMRAQARHLSGDLRGQVDTALSGTGRGLALVAFLAVGREGLETAVFLWSNIQGAGEGSGAAYTAAAFIGLLVAAVVGWLIYRRAIQVNLAAFFKVTAVALVVIAAGVLAYGIHDLQEARFLPGLDTLAWDVERQVPPSSWYGTLLKGIFNFSPKASVLEVIAWVTYFVPTMVLFFRPPAPVAPTVAPVTATAR